MTTTVTARITVRKGTAAQWTSANPTLLAGEFGYETDTDQMKIGDGTTAWTLLDYLSGGGVADHGDLTGLADDDHAQYHTDARGDARYAALAHSHGGVYEPADATILKQADVDDIPANGATTAPVSSNWAYDHAALATAHGISAFGASLVDDADAAAARTTLGLGTAATAATGDFATAAQGTLAASALQPGGALGTPLSGTLTNCTGYPIPAVKLDDAAAPDDNTDLNASASAHGLLMKLANTGTKYLRDDGTWQVVSAGSGDVVGPASSTDNTIPRFDSTTGKLLQGSVAILGDDGTFYLEGIAGQTPGNPRGAGAIDLQTSRSAATQVASGANAVAFGYRNTASGSSSVALGYSNTASATGTTALGRTSTAAATYGTAMGFLGHAEIECSLAIGAGGSAIGTAQAVVQPTYTVTTDATQTQISAGNASYTLDISAKRLYVITGTIAAMSDSTDGYKCKGWKIEAMIARDNSNSTRIIGTPTITVIGNDTDAAGWSVDSITADDTNERLNINVTGEAATTIRWVAALVLAQVGH